MTSFVVRPARFSLPSPFVVPGVKFYGAWGLGRTPGAWERLGTLAELGELLDRSDGPSRHPLMSWLVCNENSAGVSEVVFTGSREAAERIWWACAMGRTWWPYGRRRTESMKRELSTWIRAELERRRDAAGGGA